MRLAASISVVCLASCGSDVTFGEGREPDEHIAFTTVALYRMGDANAARGRVGRKAVEFCGLPRGTSVNAINLSSGGGYTTIGCIRSPARKGSELVNAVWQLPKPRPEPLVTVGHAPSHTHT